MREVAERIESTPPSAVVTFMIGFPCLHSLSEFYISVSCVHFSRYTHVYSQTASRRFPGVSSMFACDLSDELLA